MQSVAAVRRERPSPVLPSKAAAAQARRALLASASVEAAPRQLAAVEDLATLWPAGTEVYVPSPSGAEWAETLAACARLRREGLLPVPHLVARSLASRAMLDERLHSLMEQGVMSLLLIAGDAAQPAGPFADTLAVLETDALAPRGFKDLRMAVHPEGHPSAGDATLATALAAKIAYAEQTQSRLLLISQFAFAAAPVLRYWQRQASSAMPPLRVGLAGPSGLREALAYAHRCGVGASAKALARQPGLVRLAGGWSPDAMLSALAEHIANGSAAPLAGIHVFCFGGLARTARWLRQGAGAANVARWPSAAEGGRA